VAPPSQSAVARGFFDSPIVIDTPLLTLGLINEMHWLYSSVWVIKTIQGTILTFQRSGGNQSLASKFNNF